MKIKDKIKDFKKMNGGGLLNSLAEKRDKLRQFRFDLAAGKIKNVREIREIKKDIARMITISRQDKSRLMDQGKARIAEQDKKDNSEK